MRRLSSIILTQCVILSLWSQNPHGVDFKVDCASCHNPNGWDISLDTFHFNHDTTAFPLTGRHLEIDCKTCHSALVFETTPSDCISCHTDIHQTTVGTDCIRCHNTNDWLVFDVPQLHESNGFPLTGAHQGLFCIDCHHADNALRFDPIGNDCISCHRQDFVSTTNPDHKDFSTNCLECHNPDTGGWESENFDHDFFPLTLGHDIEDCKACHTTDIFSDASPDCASCHQMDFDQTVNPNHQASGFSNDCVMCHTTDIGWKPAEYLDHDNQYFPIYSGSHEAEWSACIDCHTDPNNYAEFTCISCHTNPETDENHQEILGYVYQDNACLACHPTGEKEDVFNHDATGFPLTGAHVGVDCLQCHTNGFEGTPTDCAACHQMDHTNSVNPSHTSLGLTNECASCHTTDPDWQPATFDIHDDFYPLNGAHAVIASECIACHNGDYNNTPNTCIGCHQVDYESTTDPNHQTSGFGTACLECHTEDAWTPAMFDHDVQFFPIYSGSHEGEWSNCIDCHTDPNNFSVFTCIGCHLNPETDNEHMGVGGYVYEDNACLACHPTGDADITFDHNTTAFPLTGAHLDVDCLQCHSNGFEGTPTDCAACHQMDHTTSVNPSHTSLGLTNDCASCHTTDPDWQPAIFDIHDDFYPQNGAHAAIANDCVTCHNGDYNNTPNTCVGCHQVEYNGTTNPNHQASGFSTDCIECHSEDAWRPAMFDHDAQFFPIYSGSHEGEWSDCVDCHTDPNNFSVFTCIGCHLNPETDNEHMGVGGYVYEDNACLACHPTGEADMTFDHNTTAFPLTGAHLDVDCLQCHSNGFEGTPTDCAACHQIDHTNSVNPSHTALGLSNDCASCHTTDPDWQPATFDIHDDFYPLNGAHAAIANDCASCHNGDYNNTPNTCVGCHQVEYNATTNPDHQASGFSTDCIECHSEDAWTPAMFDHDAQFFPIYSGNHEGEWSDCVDCHTDPNNFSVFTCIGCHLNPETDENHVGVGGYVYQDNACLACHSTGEADMTFDHNTTAFPLTGAHLDVDCLQCHSNGFEGTPTDCAACHQMDHINSINPSHTALGLSNDCASCHTTDPEWQPAAFAIHNDFYPLNGAHAAIANDCASCHNGDYNNTPNTCVGCHQAEYNATTNPNHAASGFSTDCMECHSEDAWTPAMFDHDTQFFPIYSGSHEGEWSACVDCHTDPNNFSVFTCIGCHINPETDDEHMGVGGYIYEDNACLMCHPTGDAMEGINHDLTGFPLTGAHIGVACIECHASGYAGTPTECAACHQVDFDNTINPNHPSLGISNDCIVCHTTDPGWAPATFDIHDNYYPLTGAHAAIANDCVMCHNGDYNNTSNTCVGCHQADYNGSTNPNHQTLGLSTDCMTCHTTDPGWMPATFDMHDNYYPLTGAHAAIANDCVMCHNGDYNNTPNTCVGCHQTDYASSTNPDHPSLGISTDCMTCHTTDPGWMPATFDVHDDYYPLTGAHAVIANDCVMCHNGDYNNTPNTCVGCHQIDYDNSSNPDHQNLAIPTDCMDCHTTDPDWMPATFDIHDDYHPLNGAHAAIANDCVICHNGDYNNTPNTCIGCHQSDFDNTSNPDHNEANFSSDCLDCHNESAWIPSSFDHNFYPLNGAHSALDCNACHSAGYVGTPNTCIACHQSDYDGTNNPDHAAAGFPTDCLDCHNENAWVPATFDHDNMYFPIYSGRHEGEWNLCIDCHIVPNDFSVFSCIDCHEHNDQADVDDDHDGVAGYIYESNACFSCHPTGEE